MSTAIRQIVPNSAPLWAVFADEKGEPLFAACVCVGTIMTEDGKQFVVGFTVGPHLEPPDAKPNFVGYADAADVERWKERTLRRRQELAVAARNAKIIVPGGGEKELLVQ